MKVKSKAYKAPNTRWITKRGKNAQYSFTKSHKMDQNVGRDGRFPFIVPAIPYERFIMNLLYQQGFFE